MEAKGNYLFMCTLTYNNESLPIYTTSTGVQIKYADIQDFQLMVKRLREKKLFPRETRYIVVSERGTERARPHFHCIWIVKKYEKDDNIYTPINLEKKYWKLILDNWQRNYGSRRNPIYKPLLTYRTARIAGKIVSNYDLHYIVSSVGDDGAAAVTYYVTKYMLKTGNHDKKLHQAIKLNYESDEAQKIWNTVKSKCTYSERLGLDPTFEKKGKGRWNYTATTNPEILKKLRKDIERSEEYAKFTRTDGKQISLAEYYKKKGEIYTLEDHVRLNSQIKNKLPGEDTGIIGKMRQKGEYERRIREYAKKVKIVSDRGDIDNYDYLFND